MSLLEDQGFVTYDDLLAALRVDLQLDPSTDLLGGVLLSVSGTPIYVSSGIVTFTWSAANISAAQTVNHGLPTLPANVLFTLASGGVGNEAAITSLGQTSFTAVGFATNGGASTGSAAFRWTAHT